MLPPLINVILSGEGGGVTAHLAHFKSRGKVDYPQLFNIPLKDRIPASSNGAGREWVFKAISAALFGAFSQLNLRVGFNEDQLCELAEAIIDESEQDQLSIEDVLLFLQQLITGKAGKIYDRMDMPTFFEMFEGYRQERHKAYKDMRYEKDCNYKAMGDKSRWTQDVDKDKNREAMGDYIKEQYKKQVSERDINQGTDH